MKITKQMLKELIKEELQNLEEMGTAPYASEEERVAEEQEQEEKAEPDNPLEGKDQGQLIEMLGQLHSALKKKISPDS